MTNSKNGSHRLNPFWKGHLTGTNRGRVTLRFDQDKESIQSQVILDDFQFGPTRLELTGKLSGKRAALRLTDFQGKAPVRPLNGQLILNFDADYKSAKGRWITDIGTQGTVRIFANSFSRPRWTALSTARRLQLFFTANARALYLAFIFAVAILGLVGVFNLSSILFVLLLVPAPVIFKNDLVELIRGLRERKTGSVELEQSPPTETMRPLISQKVKDTLRFQALDEYLVPRTRIVLNWLADGRVQSRADFHAYAQSIGIPLNNVEVTLEALNASGCVEIQDEKIKITDFGTQYVGR